MCLFKCERNWKIHMKNNFKIIYWWPCWENPLAFTENETCRSLQNQKEKGPQILCSYDSFILFLYYFFIKLFYRLQCIYCLFTTTDS